MPRLLATIALLCLGGGSLWLADACDRAWQQAAANSASPGAVVLLGASWLAWGFAFACWIAAAFRLLVRTGR
ncbi:MAG: hypothetical protein KDE27_06175 [Planctomycetes bacterium]|nr:hypothetical protein [Planctomycetota bacterium]